MQNDVYFILFYGLYSGPESPITWNYAINNKSLKIVQLVVNLWVIVPCSKPC